MINFHADQGTMEELRNGKTHFFRTNKSIVSNLEVGGTILMKNKNNEDELKVIVLEAEGYGVKVAISSEGSY